MTIEENKSCIVCDEETEGEVLCKDHIIQGLKKETTKLKNEIKDLKIEIEGFIAQNLALAKKNYESEKQLEMYEHRIDPRDVKEGIVYLVERHDGTARLAWIDGSTIPPKEWYFTHGEFLDSQDVKRVFTTGLSIQKSKKDQSDQPSSKEGR